ncbi:hypothetical protein [Clostridium estertheticum]|nr:hypothetical protein [Clostridium estertheticum]MCB2356496.1 hypothetical protein [Clostridium estertheticum]WAG43818.1 hypothetical protein LL065_24390 [Clostridium estertheticum]
MKSMINFLNDNFAQIARPTHYTQNIDNNMQPKLAKKYLDGRKDKNK